MNALFVTGTDTDVGKTWVSCALLEAFAKRGHPTQAIKPLASGFDISKPPKDTDVAMLNAASTEKLSFEQSVFAHSPTPCSPNLCIPNLSAQAISDYCTKKTQEKPKALTLIEDIGGWLCPINQTDTMAEAILPLKCPIILIVGIKLGCLNHALLTMHTMQQQQAPLIGWIANCMDPHMDMLEENIDYLKNKLPVRCLATIPLTQKPVEASQHLMQTVDWLTKQHILPKDCSHD